MDDSTHPVTQTTFWILPLSDFCGQHVTQWSSLGVWSQSTSGVKHGSCTHSLLFQLSVPQVPSLQNGGHNIFCIQIVLGIK